MRVLPFMQRVVDVATVAVVVGGYAAFFWTTRGLWDVPPGQDVRPMGMAMAMFVLGLGTPPAVMVVSNLGPARGRDGRDAGRVRDVALVVSLGLLPLSLCYLPLVAWLRGFHPSG